MKNRKKILYFFRTLHTPNNQNIINTSLYYITFFFVLKISQYLSYMLYIFSLLITYLITTNFIVYIDENSKKIPFLCYRLSGMDFLILQQRLHMILYRNSWQSATNLVPSECILFTENHIQ